MDSDQLIRKQIVYLLKGGNAHVKTEETLRAFPYQYANSVVKNVSYTAWHLIEHMRIAQYDILEFMDNPQYRSPKWPEGYWPAKDAQADENKWQKTLDLFLADLNRAVKIAEDKQLDLYAPITHAQSYTILRELLLIADHNAYHLGQLVLLRKILETKH